MLKTITRQARRVSIGAALLCSAACGYGGTSPRTSVPSRKLPAYGAIDAVIFDDTIAPEALGVPADGRSPADDSKLVPRTEQAEAVVRAKIVTVTRNQLDDRLAYRLVLRPVGDSLVGRAPSEPIELDLAPDNASVSHLRKNERALVGKTVLLFMRRYDDGGRVVTHFHLESDAPQVLEAVEHAKALDELES